MHKIYSPCSSIGLIEAYWNVNGCAASWTVDRNIGLIEAYWNVNLDLVGLHGLQK